MRKKELAIYRKKELGDLKKTLTDMRKDAVQIGSEVKLGQKKDQSEYKKKRREIAQILTIIREKEILENSDLLLQKESEMSRISKGNSEAKKKSQ